jgi:hypothetical protein
LQIDFVGSWSFLLGLVYLETVIVSDNDSERHG